MRTRQHCPEGATHKKGPPQSAMDMRAMPPAPAAPTSPSPPRIGAIAPAPPTTLLTMPVAAIRAKPPEKTFPIIASRQQILYTRAGIL